MQSANGGARGKTLDQNDPVFSTAERLAADLGVSAPTIKRDARNQRINLILRSAERNHGTRNGPSPYTGIPGGLAPLLYRYIPNKCSIPCSDWAGRRGGGGAHRDYHYNV